MVPLHYLAVILNAPSSLIIAPFNIGFSARGGTSENLVEEGIFSILSLSSWSVSNEPPDS
jgi:hypothetical protein